MDVLARLTAAGRGRTRAAKLGVAFTAGRRSRRGWRGELPTVSTGLWRRVRALCMVCFLMMAGVVCRMQRMCCTCP